MKLEFTNEVKKILIEQYIASLPYETGGILFGYYEHELKTAKITNVFYDIEDSIGKRKSFIRGKKGFNQYSKKMWSKGKYYLGEWHTHPYSLPTMSNQDKKQLNIIKETEQFNCPEPILAIVGIQNNQNTIMGYIFHKDKVHCEKIF